MPDAATITAEAFAAFADAGMLTAAVWNGIAAVQGDFRGPSRDSLGVRISGALFTCPESSMPGAKAGDSLDIGGQRYVIADRDDDGLGAMTLTLHKQ